MKNANSAIFSKLTDHFLNNSPELSASVEGVRFISTSESEKDWLKHLSIIKHQPIHPHLHTASFCFQQDEYFVIVGHQNFESIDDCITYTDLNAGIFTALVADLDISLRLGVNPYEILNEALSLKKGDDGYLGHSYSDIEKFFDPIAVFKILPQSPIKSNELARLSCYYLSKTKNFLVLPFSSETLKTFEELAVIGSSNIPFENILLSLNSFYWRFAFLDVYRCIEQVFMIHSLKDFHNKIASGISLMDLVDNVEQFLRWRPKEEEIVAKLVTASPEDVNSIFKNIVRRVGDKITNEGVWFYKTRNSIVHYRMNDDKSQLNKIEKNDWDDLIRASLLLVQYWYQEYQL